MMKKALLTVVAVLLTVFSLAGCEPTLTEDMDLMYVYVYAVGNDWIYGSDTKIFCGKGHGYRIGDTVKVEYYKTDIVEEHGTVTCYSSIDSIDSSPREFERDYDKVIKKVVFSRLSDPKKDEPVFDKPVIYLYPEKTTEVFVRLDFDGRFTQTIPAYRNGWHVIASPDGQLLADDGNTYPYLFWEGIPNGEFTITEGFCVAGSQTCEFLEKILPEIGLSEKESAEFIEYWLPLMENNPYNLIQFFGEEYLETAKLEITPSPDSVLRVFMGYRSSDEYVPLAEQTFTPFVRTGFTVVEWGGTCLD